ncbi:hypothetical protein QUC31_010127 [Theobroma cacao]
MHCQNSEDTIMDGYVVPQYGTVNFIAGDMGLDPKVWEDPMSFKLERFLSDENDGKTFDITRSKEIKMIPFGAGRRICPGHALAMLHLEYFVANPVWSFEWKAVDGDDFNMEAKQGAYAGNSVPKGRKNTSKVLVPNPENTENNSASGNQQSPRKKQEHNKPEQQTNPRRQPVAPLTASLHP